MMGNHQSKGSRARATATVLMMAAILVAHYSIRPDLLIYHDMLRRLMYVPIILAAVWFGTTGGVGVALAAALLYAPHLFFQQQLPSVDEIDSAAEMLLYVVVGGLTGLLTEREKWQRFQMEDAFIRLQQAHDQLRRQADQLAEVQEGLRQVERLSTLGELAANLAHEVRNPLAALRGTVQILAAEFPSQHRKHEFADILIHELDRLDTVVEGYLRTARSHGARHGQSDAVAALNTVIQLIQRHAQRSGVAVEHHGLEHLLVAVDIEQLTQIFLNLALNAVQAMPNGGALEVTSTVLPARNNTAPFAEVTFADTGPGVAPENRSRIFEPFFTTKTTGTGLGLSIARRLVTEHGGRLTLEVPDDGGSIFRVRLPLGHQ